MKYATTNKTYSMVIRLHFVVLIIFSLQHNSFGQESSAIFEIIKDDSVRMFFNERNKFIEKKCSDFVRYTRVDAQGNFNGYYRDISNDNNVLVSKGHYVHGKKHGYFEVYYPNGKIRCKGNYVENRPVGQWEYFYENELPERTIKITELDTLLIRFVDKKGNVKVNGGNGEFDGPVAANLMFPSLVIAKGAIEDGSPVGKWSSTTLDNRVFCKEEFDHGILIRGVFPNAVPPAKKEYRDRSFLNTFFMPTYLNSLEEFRGENCGDSAKYTTQKYTFNIQGFKADVSPKIDRIIEDDFKNRRSDEYLIGDNYLTIQFSVDDQGKAYDFALLSAWGNQFFSAITSSIKRQTSFPPNVKTMFFHLKLHFPGGFTYRYNFQFSRNKSFN